MNSNNQVNIVGESVSSLVFSHESFGEKFYVLDLRIPRLSGAADFIPIHVSERIIDVTQDCVGKVFHVSGQYRSFNFFDNGKSQLMLKVFATEIEVVEYSALLECKNEVMLKGYICKTPNYRKTPLNREITDLLVAVNRVYGKSDYLPCICWGRDARYASTFPVGSEVQIQGRIQSREYVKRHSEHDVETRVAYEVSVSNIQVVDETTNQDEGDCNRGSGCD